MKPDLRARSSEEMGARRRRFWSSDEKRRMVAESLKPGASKMAMVVQRYGVTCRIFCSPGGLSGGRRGESRSCAEPVKLVPVTVAEAEAPECRFLSRRQNAIGQDGDPALRRGLRIIVGVDVDAMALAHAWSER